jgi:hypothetical protein
MAFFMPGSIPTSQAHGETGNIIIRNHDFTFQKTEVPHGNRHHGHLLWMTDYWEEISCSSERTTVVPGINMFIIIWLQMRYAGMLGIFESPEPWGPWFTVEYASEETWFGHDYSESVPRNCFFWCFPVKWISEDGRSATMVFTGGGRGRNNDSFNAVRVKFINP